MEIIKPALENLIARMKNGNNEMNVTGLAVDDKTHLTITMKIGTGPVHALGTLIVPMCDWPVLGAVFTLGCTMMRVDYQCKSIVGNARWEAGDNPNELPWEDRKLG